MVEDGKRWMDSGRLRHTVTIETPTAGAPDALGVTTDTWATFATVRAEIVPQSARETYRAMQVNPEMTHLLRIRYCSGVAAKMRLKYGSRYLYIVSVINVDERNREMQLVCEEQL